MRDVSFRVAKLARFPAGSGWIGEGPLLRGEAQRKGSQNLSTPRHCSSTHRCHEPRPSRIVMLNNLGCRQMFAVCSGVAVFKDHGSKTKCQCASDSCVDAKLRSKPTYDQLGHAPFAEKCEQISIQKCVARFLWNACIFWPRIESRIQGMAGLRRMKWITLGAAVLNEDHLIAICTESFGKVVEAPYDLIPIVARRRKQALLDIYDQKTALSHDNNLRSLDVDLQALSSGRFGVVWRNSAFGQITAKAASPVSGLRRIKLLSQGCR